MMTQVVTSTQAARHFTEYLHRVAHRRESFIVVRGDERLAEIRPIPTGARLSDLPSLMASLPHLSADDAEAFGRDIDEARESLGRARV